jgi:ubiquinone biosynthesis protein COQ9
MDKHENSLRQKIIDKALELADKSSWEGVRLYDIAKALNIELDVIYHIFCEKDEIIDAFFARADLAMLQKGCSLLAKNYSPQDVLHQLLMSWFEPLAPYKKVCRQMIGSKLEFGHVHIQIPALMRISRTVQWWREAGKRKARFLKRALEETALTTVYLATFFHWLSDESDDCQKTNLFLKKRLENMTCLLNCCDE